MTRRASANLAKAAPLAFLLTIGSALGQSAGTLNLAGPSTTPGAPTISTVKQINDAVNAALGFKWDYGDHLVIGAATGGSQGPGTVNATGLFVNGVPVGSALDLTAPGPVGTRIPGVGAFLGLSGSVTATGSPIARSLSDRAADTLNVKDFGATGNAQGNINGAMTSGQSVLSSTLANWTSGDVGKLINIGWAVGTVYSALNGSITGFTDSHHVTVSFTAPANITGATYNYGTDDSAAIAAAVTSANALIGAGQHVLIYFPGGNYYIAGTPIPMFTYGGSVTGDARQKTYIVVDPAYSGDIFSWNEAWDQSQWPGPFFAPAADRSGPMLRDITITGNYGASNQQNAIMLYGRTDNVLMENVTVVSLHGRGWAAGLLTGSDTAGTIRESHFYNMYFYTVGTATLPTVEITATGPGNASDELEWYGLNILGNPADGLVIRNASTTGGHLAQIRFFGIRAEGSITPAAAGDEIRIGDTSAAYGGSVSDIYFYGAVLNTSAAGHADFGMYANSTTQQPYAITLEATTVAGFGTGLNILAGRDSKFFVADMSTIGSPQVNVGPSPLVGSGLVFEGNALTNTWTWAVDGSVTGLPQTPATYTASSNNNLNRSSMSFGESNTPGLYGFNTGFNNTGGGNYSQGHGVASYGRARYAVDCHGSTIFTSGDRGDAQGCEQVLAGTTAGVGTVTLTSGGNAPDLTNILNMAAASTNGWMAMTCKGQLTAIREIASPTMASWDVSFGLSHVITPSNATTLVWNTVAFLGGDATLQADVAIAVNADNTFGGADVTATVTVIPDPMRFSAPFRCSEVQ